MKILSFTLILIFFSLISKTQSVDKAFKLYNNEQYHEASIEFEKLVPILKIAYGDKDTVNYSKFLIYTGVSFARDLNFHKAEKYYLESLSIYESFSPIIPCKWHAIVVNNLAELYTNVGRYAEAKDFHFKALDIKLKLYLENNSNIATSYNNIASFYREIGEFDKAETYIIKALKIDKEIFGEGSSDYAIDLNNLALLYQTIGNYPKAEENYLKVIEIREKVIGKNSVDYAVSLNNLASLYAAMDNFEKAEKLYLASLEIVKNSVGKEHENYATALNNIASLYSNKKKYEEAEKYYLEAEDIYEKIYGEENVERANIYNNLGTLYHRKKEYKKSESFYEKSIDILKKIYGNTHFEYAKAISNLSGLYYNWGKYKKTEKYLIEVDSLMDKFVINSGLFMSEAERDSYLANKIIYQYDAIYSFYFAQKDKNPEYAGFSYNNALLLKGILLRSNVALRNSVLNSNDEKLIELYNEWILNGTLLLHQQSTPEKQRTFSIDSLSEIVNMQEKQLISQFPQTFKNISNTNWNDIKNSLKEDEAAVEFINFKYHTEMYWSDSIFYCALVLTKEMNYPEIIFLCEEKQLENLLYKNPDLDFKYDNPEYYYIKDIYDKTSSKSDSLFKFVWQPIEYLIEEKKKIYISPSGLLNRIAFDAVPLNQSEMVSDKYEIIYLSSTANLVAQPDLYIKDLKKFILFGGINFSADTNAIKKYAESTQNITVKNSALQKLNSDNRSGLIEWTELKGSKKEVENIQNLLKQNNTEVELYTGFEATEAALKKQKFSQPSMIHIATHGFYFPETAKEEIMLMGGSAGLYSHVDNPLVRSGIVMAGANWSWSGTNNIFGSEDGILSAYEVSHLDLFNVKLAVLSACQTGLGDVKGSEGVYGLQRGLKMAGVDYIILSLWEVPDEQTQQLMTKFYTYFYQGLEVRQAFKKAQNDLKEEYRDVKGGMYAWAAFVLIY